MAKKRDSEKKLVKIKDSINLVNQSANILGIVLVRKEPKRCRNNDWLCTLGIIDDSYSSPGLTVNVFSNTLDDLPCIKNHHDIILFTRVKIKAFDSGINAACDKRVSSFALYEKDTNEDYVCYQCTSNFHEEEEYMSSIEELGKWFATSSSRVNHALENASTRKIADTLEYFSFLREIKEGNYFDLVCKVLYVDDDKTAVFVWDGTDAPPPSILTNENEDKALSRFSVHTLLSREILLRFPTVGTILNVSGSTHLFNWVKRGEWVKLHHLLCKVDKGSWVGVVTDSTTINLAQDDCLVEKIKRIYDKRMSTKLGHIPFWSFPAPPCLTVTDYDRAPFVTLMDIITFPKVTYKYRCIVRVVAAYPWHVEDFYSDENRGNQVLLTLEDPTASLEAFLCNKDAEDFWGLGFEDKDMVKKKWNQLLGTRESSEWAATREPPWIECCILSYYTHKANPWKTRLYRIFGTRLLV